MNILNNIREFFVPKNKENFFWFGQQSLSKYLNIRTKDDILTAYYQTPTLRAIIDKGADIFSNVGFEVYDKLGNETYNHYLVNIFNNPHPIYSKSEFLKTYYKQIKLFNEVFIYVNTSSINVYNDKTKFLILPAQNMTTYVKTGYDIKNITNINDYVDYYELNVNGQAVIFKTFEIIHITDTVLKIDSNSIATADLSLRSAEQPINVIRSAYEMRVGLNYKKGGLGIFVNAKANRENTDVNLNPKDIQKFQDDLAKYSYNKTDFNDIVTNMNVDYKSTVPPIAQLEINEGIRQAKIDLCDVTGFNILSLNSLEGATFSNKESAEKQLYTSLIIPEWLRFQSEFNNYNLDKRFYLKVDYDDVEVLQKDKKTELEKLNLETDTILKLNEKIVNKIITKDIAVKILVDLYDYKEEEAMLLVTNDIVITTTSSNTDTIDVDSEALKQQRTAQANLRGTVGGVQGIMEILRGVKDGVTDKTSARNILMEIYGFTLQTANSILN